MKDSIVTLEQKGQMDLFKKNSLEQKSYSTLDQNDSYKNSTLEVNSEHYIRYRDEKSKYKSIREQLFLDNNFTANVSLAGQQYKQSQGLKSYAHQLKYLGRKQHKSSNIKVLLKTQYPLIYNLVQKYFYYKFYNKQDHFNDIFLIWMDTYVSEQFIKRLKSYQRINHFPSSCQLGRKDLLSANIKMAKKCMKEQYSFYPNTWILPKEYDIFCEERVKNKFYIVKPHANCQGRGIYLTKNPAFTIKQESVVQEYIDNPMLIDGCKFDLRIYVLLRSLDPLRIYVYKEGLCRLATSKYVKPDESNFRNDKMHLTNYAINKWDPGFIANKDINHDDKGHKRSYTSIIKYLASNGFDTAKIEERIDSIIVRTILSAYTKMLRSYRKARQNNTSYLPVKEGRFKEQNGGTFNKEEPSVCFELLGFDIMLLETGQPILLEINHQPSLVADSPFDMAVKRSLLMDTINILNLEQRQKDEWEKCQKQGRPYICNNQEERQGQLMGGYKCIYPLNPQNSSGKRNEQINKIQNTKLFYETIMNKFIMKYFKCLNKVKMGHYRTIGSKVDSRRKVIYRDQVRPEEQFSPVAAQRSKSNKNRSTQKQKAVALTFYNLFNDAKYYIKKSSTSTSKQQMNQQLEPQDCVLKNHIYLAAVQETIFNRGSTAKRTNRSPYLQAKSREKVSVKDKIQLRDIFKEDSEKQHSPSLSLSLSPGKKIHDTLTSIRNRGIMSYVTARRHKKQTEIKNIDEKCNLSCEPYSRGTDIHSSQTQKSNNTAEPSWKKLVITNHEPDISKFKNELPTRNQEYRNIYINSISERVQKITSLKLNKKDYQKMNFASFLDKQKKHKNLLKLKQQNQSDDKQTSPSAQ